MTAVLWTVMAVALPGGAAGSDPLREALTFHASFDGDADADLAAGDKRIYTAPPGEPDAAKAGIQRGDVTIAKGKGRFGDALRFGEKKPGTLFFHAKDNVDFRPIDWSGTVSFWLRLDPDKDLKPGYCDPIQITDKSALDEAIFVEFSKDHAPRRFRMAVPPTYKEWNPDDRDWESIPVADRPIVEVTNPPFGGAKWTHVAVSFANFNSDKADGEATLYLDGKPAGTVSGWKQNYRWAPAKARVMLGLSYIGLFDDLALFNRALTAEEVEALYRLPEGVAALHR